MTRLLFSSPARNSSRLGQRLQIALGAAAALAAISLTPGSAEALVVTVDSVEYEVTTFTGNYLDYIGKFETAANGGVMPWWGNQQLALDFAEIVGAGFGAPNGPFGPYFAYEFIEPSVSLAIGLSFGNNVRIVGTNNEAQSVTWAQATEVPGPLPALGAAAAFGFSRKLRKRIKGSPNAVCSTYSL